MNKNRNRNTRIIAIIALTIAVFGYSIGFSAYSTTLKMQNIQAIVKGDSSKFKVTLSTASNSTNLDGTKINKFASGGPHSNTQVNTVNSVTMNATTINNIGGTFGYQGAMGYTFYVRNIGDIDAYLTSVVYSNNNKDPSCNAASHVLTVCEDVTLNVKIYNTQNTSVYSSSKTTNNNSIKSAKLAVGEYHKVTIDIRYTGVNTVISDFSIDYGSITLNYSSQDNK